MKMERLRRRKGRRSAGSSHRLHWDAVKMGGRTEKDVVRIDEITFPLVRMDFHCVQLPENIALKMLSKMETETLYCLSIHRHIHTHTHTNRPYEDRDFNAWGNLE